MSISTSTHRTRAALSTLLALVSLNAAGCSERSDVPTATSAGAPTTDATAPATGPNGCAWRTRADRATENIAYPDTAATYWAMAYELAPNEQLVLRGRFPDARYQSFTTYDTGGEVVAGLADRDIDPIDGDVNPFAGRGGDAGGRFAVTVDPDATGPNQLAGLESGTVVHRVYRSNVADDPTGGVGLPEVALVRSDGTQRVIPTCDAPGANPRARALVAANGPDTTLAAPAVPVFVGAEGTNLYANPDNAYLATLVEHRPGRIVVVRGRAPTFPDTGRGQIVRGDEQVRFWSLCTNEWRSPYPVSDCVADEDVALDDDGWFTIVVSTRTDRPATIGDHPHVTWIEWGATDVDLLLLVRQMLAAAGFSGAAARVAPGDVALATLGEYAPVAMLCTRARFDRLGPDGCR